MLIIVYQGHNDHTNEVQPNGADTISASLYLFFCFKPSHHIPYLYSLAGAASRTQERIRQIARDDYNNTVIGLAGVSFTCLVHFPTEYAFIHYYNRTKTAAR